MMSITGRITGAERAKQDTLIWDLKWSKISIADIAEKLRISRNTVYQSLKRTLKENFDEVQRRGDITAKAYANTIESIQEAWALYRRTSNESTKLGALSRIDAAIGKLLTMAGISLQTTNIQNIQSMQNIIEKEYVITYEKAEDRDIQSPALPMAVPEQSSEVQDNSSGKKKREEPISSSST